MNEIEKYLAERKVKESAEREKMAKEEAKRSERLSSLLGAFQDYESFVSKGARVEINDRGLLFSLDDIKIKASSYDGERFEVSYNSSKKLVDGLKNAARNGDLSREDLIGYILNEFKVG